MFKALEEESPEPQTENGFMSKLCSVFLLLFIELCGHALFSLRKYAELLYHCVMMMFQLLAVTKLALNGQMAGFKVHVELKRSDVFDLKSENWTRNGWKTST